jgi:hypothetical protein
MVIEEYTEIIQFIMQDHTDTDTYKYEEETLKIRLRHWLSYFLIFKEKISMYVHIFVFHYFRQSSKKKNLWQKQLLQKQNRMEFIYHKGEFDELPASNIDIDVIYNVY